MSTSSSARLLRAIGDELAQRLIPELSSADALERASLARLVLEHLAADIDVLADVADDLVPELRAGLEHALGTLPPTLLAGPLKSWREELLKIPVEHGLARQREILALRSLAAHIVRRAADVCSTASASEAALIAGAIARLGTLDHRWLSAYESAREKRKAEENSIKDTQERTAPAADIGVDAMTRYLRSRYPGSPQIQASSVVSIPGGRSKKTYFISVTGTSELSAQFVMRQDYALRYEGTKVRDEYAPLMTLSQLGLSVPRPLLLEAQPTELGPPFIFVERLAGGSPGSYFGMRTPCPGAFADLARVLAKLHRVDPAQMGLTVQAGQADSLMQLIDTFEKKWRENATRASPLVDYAYAWARAECAKDPGMLAVVHGDAGPYNLLVDNDRLTALLDWEFMQIGDPAVDLGIVRVYAEEFMRWEDFIGVYRAAGGATIPERRIQLAMVVNFLKGTTLVAASGRNFEEGGTREFVKGSNAFTGLRLIEMRIDKLLQRFGAV